MALILHFPTRQKNDIESGKEEKKKNLENFLNKILICSDNILATTGSNFPVTSGFPVPRTLCGDLLSWSRNSIVCWNIWNGFLQFLVHRSRWRRHKGNHRRSHSLKQVSVISLHGNNKKQLAIHLSMSPPEKGFADKKNNNLVDQKVKIT